MGTKYERLFETIKIKNIPIKNRLYFPPHATTLQQNGIPTDALVAYHAARVEGGVGLIITEAATIHSTFRNPLTLLSIDNDEAVPAFAKLAEMCHDDDCRIFGQLFHPGRGARYSEDGSRPVAYAPSAVPDEMSKIMPSPLTKGMIQDIVASYASAAKRMKDAAYDGVEIAAGMGYLIAEFMNPRLNLREDEYGGEVDGRLRFFREVVEAIRNKCGSDFVVGARMSADEFDHEGLTAAETLQICEVMDASCHLDFIDFTGGNTISMAGWIRAIPPMAVEHNFLAPLAEAIKSKVTCTVMVAGRINLPEMAERIIANGQADMCGMVRPQITDPEFANKAREGRAEDIRACIG